MEVRQIQALILVVGICFNGISRPIYLAFLLGYDITSLVEVIEVMEGVVSLVGSQRIECLLADHDFGNVN